MDNAVIVALITGACSVLAVIVSNASSNRQIDIKLDKTVAVLEERIAHLTSQVEKHNEVITRTYECEKDIAEIKATLHSMK